MKIEPHTIIVRELVKGYRNDETIFDPKRNDEGQIVVEKQGASR